jgi:hypothetical protein
MMIRELRGIVMEDDDCFGIDIDLPLSERSTEL